MRFTRRALIFSSAFLGLTALALVIHRPGSPGEKGATASAHEGRRVLTIVERGERGRIYVRFDRPIVEPEAIGSAAPLEVDLPGRALWTGAATASFIPSGELPPSRAFAVRLGDVVALDGTRLPSAVSWTFRTPGLSVRSSLPSTTGPSPRFKLEFDRPVETFEIERHARFVSGDRRVAARVRDGLVEPVEPLMRGSQWRLDLAPGLSSRDGWRLEEGWSDHFSVAPDLTLDRAEGQSSLRDTNAIRLGFSASLAAQDAKALVSVTPEVPHLVSVSGREMTLWGDFAPGATYWVRVAEGLKGAQGDRMDAAARTVQIPAYAPSLTLVERSAYVERWCGPAVPLESVNVPRARWRLKSLAHQPWERAPDGEVFEEREFDANAEPNEIFTHGIRLPGPGAWLVEAEACGLPLADAALYQVTDLAPAFKLGRERSLACVTSFETGLPLQGVALELRGERGGLVWSGETGLDGCATAPGLVGMAVAPRYLLARTADDGCWLDLERSALSTWRLAVDHQSPAEPEPLEILLFTDRPLYRPGETVRVKGWWRNPSERSVALEIRGRFDEPLDRVSCPLSAEGGFDAAFRLPEGATGGYDVVATVGKRSTSHRIEVACYRPPSFEVKVEAQKARYFRGERAAAVVEARAFFGAPLAGARVRWWAQQSDGAEHSGGEGTLGEDGRLAFNTVLGPGTGTIRFFVSVTDAAHQTVSAETSVPVFASELSASARSESWCGEAGRPLAFGIEVRNVDGAPVEREVGARLIRRTWSSLQQLTVGRGWTYVSEKRDELVATEIVRPGRWSAVPKAPGPHLLELRVRDDAGRESLTSIEVDVLGPGEAGWRPRDDLQLAITPERELWRAGETARVIVRNAMPGAWALLTLEREGVIERSWRRLEGNVEVLEIPVGRDHAPNVHVGLLQLSGRTGWRLGPFGEDGGCPRSRYAYATLRVDVSDRRVPVEVKASERASPGAEITVEVRTAPGAEIALAVVDDAVLALVGDEDPDPHGFFSRPRPLRVTSHEARPDLAARRPLDVRGKKGHPGGGGGDKEGSAVRRRFVGTAYWNPRLVADAEGRASATFRLPDNLTRWRLRAAVAAGGRWGAGRAFLRTEKPLLVQPALPRFALLGDAFVARLVVTNSTGAEADMKVELDGAAQEKRVSVGKSAAFDFPVTADRAGARTFQARAVAGLHEDRVEVALPVIFPGAKETAVASGRLRGRGTIDPPSLAHVESVSLAVAANEAALMEAELERLLDYPNGCVEQTSSKTLPLIALHDLGIRGAEGKIDAGVGRLLSMQTPSGGMAYWPGGGSPHPAGSVYATHALVLASDTGISVPRQPLKRALDYIEHVLKETGEGSRSYALYVLALAGRRHEAYLESLPPDPFTALAAVEMGRPERAREILLGGKAGRTPSMEDFDSEARMAAVRLMVRTRLGEKPRVRVDELLRRAVLTFERAWMLLALRDLVKAAERGKGRRVRVFEGARLLADRLLDGVVRLEVPHGGLRIETDGDVHYAATVRGRSGESGPEDRGFWVRRTYTRAGEELPRLDFKAGDLVVVRVMVSATSERSYVALEDPLPAGFEPVDLRFRTEDRRVAESHDFEHVERRDDRVFASLRRMGPGLRELVYLARATTAGRFASPAPWCEEMYSPQTSGRGKAATVTVEPR